MHIQWAALPLMVALFVVTVSSKRQTRQHGGSEPLEDWQMTYLEKIRTLAKEAGVPEEDRKKITKFDKDVCYTRDCLETAVEIMEATNFSVDPCNQNKWMDYACGRRVHGVDNINQVERQMKVMEQRTRQILEEMDLENEFLLKEAQVYYHQCSKKGLHDKRDLKDILSYLKENYGEFPLISNRKPGPKFNWLNMVADMNRFDRPGFRPLLFEVKYNPQNSEIELKVGQTSFPSSDLGFWAQFAKKLQSSGGLEKPIRLEQFSEMFPFLDTIRTMSYANVETDNRTISINDLQKFTNKRFRKLNLGITVNWLEFFQRIFKGSGVEIDGDNTDVDVEVRSIMNVFKAVDQQFSSDSESAVSNALNLHFFNTLLLESTDLLDDINGFRCTEQSGERDEICLSRVKDVYGYSLGKTYLNVFYDYEKSTPAIFDLMDHIKRGYIDVINGLDWMEDSTKKYLVNKIEKMPTFVVVPPSLEEPGKLEEFYKDYNSSTDKNSPYFENYLSVETWKKMKKLDAELKKKTLTPATALYDETQWNHWLATVNAKYYFDLNQAVVEGGIVHHNSPFFGVKKPGFINFGGLGMVLAHEIGHSFDTGARQFDENGQKGEHWDPKTVQRYNEWTARIIEDYTSDGHQTSETSAETVDSSRTLNENIADELGIYIAFMSYQKYLKDLEKKGKKEKVLPGLKNVPPQKLFYMKYSNMWCDNKPTQDRFNSIFFGPHSTGNARATVPVKRSRKFAETFGCEMPRGQF